MAAAALVVTGVALGGWQLAVHLTAHGARHSRAQGTPAAPTASPTPSGVAPDPTPSGVAPDPTPPQSVGGVTISPDAAQNQAATGVAQFLSQYFTAINNHDYQAYTSLVTPQAQMSSGQFASGYRSTADSAETLTGISTTANGDLQADVTFTSHQNPADSVDGTQSCTDWTISLFLGQNGSGYLIDQSPAGYQASYAAC